MSNLKPLTIYYFSIDGRDGLAHVDDGKCVDSAMHFESYLREIASAALADIERLKFTFTRLDISCHVDKLSCLYSIKNIIDSDVKVVCCDADGRWYRYEPESVMKIVYSLLNFCASDEESEDVKASSIELQSFLSHLDDFISEVELARKEKISDDETRVHLFSRRES